MSDADSAPRDVPGDLAAAARWIWRARWRRWPLTAALVVLGGTVLAVAPLRWIDPPATPLMLTRVALGEAEGIDARPIRLGDVAPVVARTVLASEDMRFCAHRGVDWEAAQAAVEEWRAGEGLRGASTITMQTARSVFLPPSRTALRKAVELWLTPFVETFWPKRRILEHYLNVAEWGPGVYGIEAAAQRAFGRGADRLTPRQAALLVAALPNPMARDAGRPTATQAAIARRLERRTARADWAALAACIE